MNTKDLIYYKNSDGNIKSLGYNFKNLLLERGLPTNYSGGNKNVKKFYDNIEDFCIPTTLVLLNKRVEDIHKNPTIFDLYDDLYKTTTINDEFDDDGLYDKLLNISGYRKSKTRKNRKKSKKYTRKKV